MIDRTVLVGDAAHPVGAGQGASMAIEDAVVLARELHRRRDVPIALASFVDLRRARLGKARARRPAGIVTPRRPARWPHGSGISSCPCTFNRFYEKATGWLYDYDPGRLPTATRDRA